MCSGAGALDVTPPGRPTRQRVAPTGPPLFPSAGIMARGCTKVATSFIDASVAGVGVLIAGRVAGGVMAVWWLRFWILPCQPWVDDDGMLVDSNGGFGELMETRWRD